MTISDVFDEPLMSAAQVGLGAIHIDFGFCSRSSISNQWLVRGDQSLLQRRQQLVVEQRVCIGREPLAMDLSGRA